MYESNRELIDALKATPDTLTALLTGVTQAEAQAAKGGDEGWSVVEVLCHLRDAEEISLQRTTLMRDQDNPDIVPFDQEKLAVERNYAADDLHAALFAFIRNRRKHVAALENLPPEAWERSANHLEFGQITIFSFILHKVVHDAVHCAQIGRQLNA
jgi:uncharacterized damage-inducible protein DinB